MQKDQASKCYVAQYSRTDFIKIHRNGDTTKADGFNMLVDKFDELVASDLLLKAQVPRQATFQPPLSFRRKPRQRL